jgi:hypothetical protein
VRSQDVVFMEDQTIHDIEKTGKVVPQYSDGLIDLDTAHLIDLLAHVDHDVQNDQFKMTSKLNMIFKMTNRV